MSKWMRIGPSHHNNCTDFAFEEYPDLVFINDIEQLIFTARGLGWRETSALSDAEVVLYGSIDNDGYATAYSHAIRRIDSGWEEVYGNDHNRWIDSVPPLKHHGDYIVAMLYVPRK